ncbi:MAG: hypothetical protein ACJ78M_02550 [Gemmatimonadaceae bacterium]
MIEQSKPNYLAESSELLTALTESIDQALDDQRALRFAVCTYIAGQKGRGVTLEEITETVRSILARADRGLIVSTFGALERIERYAKELVDWCVANDQRILPTTA